MSGAAAASAVAQLGSSAFGYFGQLATNKSNRQIAREQMAFQERMFKNQHQYRVEDLRAAGLNPILSTHAGGSTPQGAGIAAQNPASYAANTGKALADLALISNMARKEKANAVIAEANAVAAKNDMMIENSAYGRFLAGVRKTTGAIGNVFKGSARLN